jgi:cellulose synthase/poly-beta-1,6-N-acetylglucosamine synthase-like glycosyltransferase
LRDAAREMALSPEVAIIQHESGEFPSLLLIVFLWTMVDDDDVCKDVLQIAHHYFENGIAYFTRRINRCVSMSASLSSPLSFLSLSLITTACANGEVAPFMGHNAFMRWRALQDAAFIDPADGKEKIWSEANVSEDFDLSMRLQLRGYIVRCVLSVGGV